MTKILLVSFLRTLSFSAARIQPVDMETTWNYRSKTNFSICAAAKYSQNFRTFAQMDVAVYERNII